MNEVSKFIPVQENEGVEAESNSIFRACENNNLPTKPTFFSRLKSALFYDIKVELTPYEQKIENEINEFLHQEITWGKVHDFLFQDITFGNTKTNA